MSFAENLPLAFEHHMAGRRSEAEVICRQVLEDSPEHPGALQLLAMMAHSQGRFGVALRLAEMAVRAAPGGAEYYNTLGAILADYGTTDEAVVAFEMAIRCRPHYIEACRNLGTALARIGRLRDAVEAYRAALDLNPSSSAAQEILQALTSTCHESLDLPGMLDARRRLTELLPGDAQAHDALLYDLHYDATVSLEAIFQEHLRWARQHAFNIPHISDDGASPSPYCDQDRRLRVGYVSAGFRNHPVTRFQEAEMAAREPHDYELFCYSSAPKADAATKRLKKLADTWRDVADLSDEALAEQICADRIDVLVDLDGHDQGNRLLTFARRPALIQATYNGYMNTTGMAAMDWRITDGWHDTPGMTDGLYTEKLFRLPKGNWCYTPDEPAVPVNELPALRNGHITFGSLNKLIKVSPPCLKLWARILEAVPDSRLLLIGEGEEASRKYQTNELGRRGLPVDRIELIARSPRHEYMQRFGAIDIGLDPFPFNGITTTADALWMGVPVVTLAGNTFASRAGVSLMSMVRLPEFIAQNEEHYLRIATDWAGDIPRLARFRQELRPRMLASPLCDGRRLARELSAAFRAMFFQKSLPRS